jgi:hypothetical protein
MEACASIETWQSFPPREVFVRQTLVRASHLTPLNHHLSPEALAVTSSPSPLEIQLSNVCYAVPLYTCLLDTANGEPQPLPPKLSASIILVRINGPLNAHSRKLRGTVRMCGRVPWPWRSTC